MFRNHLDRFPFVALSMVMPVVLSLFGIPQTAVAQLFPGPSDSSQQFQLFPGSSDRSQQLSAFGDIAIMPNDRRQTIQPLAPGYSWTYRISVRGKPKLFRWFTIDGETSDRRITAFGLFKPWDKYGPGEYSIEISVSDQTKVVKTFHENKFYRIMVTDLQSGEDVTKGEDLYWGRVRYDPPFGLAIAELRDARSFSASLVNPSASSEMFHLRYLGGDLIFNLSKREVMVPQFKMQFGDRWKIENIEGFKDKVTVPAGTFDNSVVTVVTQYPDFERDNQNIIDTSFYKVGVGLVKWEQSGETGIIAVGELTGYHVSP